MNLGKEKIIDHISTHVRHSIRDQVFRKVDYFSMIALLLQEEFNCQCAFLDKNLNIIQRVGFASSPRKLDEDYKSLDPKTCLTKAIQILKRQFTQEKPILATGKMQDIFHVSYALAGIGEVPNYIMVIKFAQLTRYEAELFTELVNYISSQLYIYEQQEEEDLFHRHYISSLQRVIHAKSPSLAAHCKRVAQYCKTIGALLKLNKIEMNHLTDAALIHDIGYVNVPNEIVNRPGRLTNTELMCIRKTVEEGYKIISSKELFDLESIGKIIFCHMENYDGSGYPRGLKKNQIPRLSRILGIANAYDAMTSPRPYQDSLSHEEANEELKRCSGLNFNESKARGAKASTQFDPNIVEKFVQFQMEWT